MEIDIHCLKKLFKYRSEQDNQTTKPESNLTIINLFNQIPSYSWSEKYSFFNDLNNSKNMKSALSNLGYNYPFKKEILVNIIQERNEDSEYPIIIANFQLISLLFLTDNGETISTDDFSLFMQILNFKNSSSIPYEINLLFDFLLKAALRTPNFEWNKININSVFQQFSQNKALSPSFLILFNEFAKIIFNFIEESEIKNYQTKIVDLLALFYKENRDIIKNFELSPIFDWIEPLLTELNSNSLFILSHTSKQIDSLPKSSILPMTEKLQKLILLLPPLFVKETKSANFELSKPTEIHKLVNTFPIDKFTQNKLFDFEFTTEKLFKNEQLSNLPESIVSIKEFALFDRFDSNARSVIDKFYMLTSNLSQKWTFFFLESLCNLLKDSYCQSEHYCSFASFLFLLWRLDSKTKEHESVKIDIVKYLAPFLDSFLFDASYTIFGPKSLDNLLNDFRQTVIDILVFNNFENPILKLATYNLLRNQKFNPFLLTETITRLIVRIPLEILLNTDDTYGPKSLLITEKEEENLTIIEKDSDESSKLNEFLKLVSNTALALKIMNAPIEPRNSIIFVMFEILTNSFTSYKALTTPNFVDCMFNFVFENGLSQMFLTVIHKSLLYADKKIKPLQYIVDIMYHSIRAVTAKMNDSQIPDSIKNDFIIKIKTRIYNIVSNLIQLKPRMTKLFERFVMPMLADVNSQESMSDFILVLIAFSSKRYFRLQPTIFSLLAQKIQFITYNDILNLIGMSSVISSESMFFFRRPCYLPFLFIAFNNDDFLNHNTITFQDVIDYLKELAEYSEYNRRGLHDGQIDYIILSYLNKENPICINGFPLSIKTRTKRLRNDFYYLLDLIVPSKSSNQIANKLINSLILNPYNEAHKLYKIISKAMNEPKPQFPIGNFQAFCRASNLNYFFKDSDFTVSFTIKIDANLLEKSTSQVLILSIYDRNGKRISISLINHSLCATYMNNDTQTIVILCQIIPPNEWCIFNVIFSYNKSKSLYQITTYMNAARQHDSEFCNIKLDITSNLSLLLGSSLYEGRTPTKYFEQVATLSVLTIYGHSLKTKDELISVITKSNDQPKDIVFTTDKFNENMYKSTQKVMFYNNNVLDIKYVKNRYENTTIDMFLSNYNALLINHFKSIDSIKYQFILPILALTLKSLKSNVLIKKFASILIDLETDKLSYFLFKNLYEIYFSLYQSDFKEYKEDQFHLSNSWLEFIVFNTNIWKKSKEFNRIFHLWSISISNNVICNRFFKNDAKFSSFLCYFDEFISNASTTNSEINQNTESALNKTTINEFILFLARVACVNLTAFDVQHLLSALSNCKTFYILKIYLKLIRYVADSLRNSEYELTNQYDADEFSSIYALIQQYCSKNDDESINIVLLSIIALHEIYFHDFHLKVVKIYKSFSALSSKDFKRKLFDRLESKVEKYPNLFSLTCCIAFDNHDSINDLKVIPKPHQISKYELWFFFPLLLAMNNFSSENNSELSVKLFKLLATNAIDGPYMKHIINTILVFTKLASVNLIESKDQSFPDELLYFLKLLQELVVEGNAIEYCKIIYTIYFDAIAFVCYHLNYSQNIEKKIVIDSIGNLELFVNKFFKGDNAASLFSFNYKIELIDEKQILHKRLLLDMIELSNNFLKSYTLYKKYKKSQKTAISIGDSSVQTLDFQIPDINNVLTSFIIKFDQENPTSNFTIEDFQKMNSIFEWMHDKLNKKFVKHFAKIKIWLVNHLFAFKNDKYITFDPQFWINYQKSTFNWDLQFIKEIMHQTTRDNEFSEPLPIMTSSFGTFLYQNPHQDEKAKGEEFSNSLSLIKDEDADSDPNAYNIKYGIKIPVRYLIDTNNFVLRNEFIPYSMFSYVISMSPKEKRNEEEKSKIDGMIENSILFILKNQICFLIGFERGDEGKEQNLAFLQEIKKKLNPECQIFNSRDEMIEKLAPTKIKEWLSHRLSTFDLLCILNLLDGRTYLASGKNRMSDLCDPNINQYYPLFPSLEFLTNEKSDKIFDDAEIYFLLDMNPKAYENRKLLEKSDRIDLFIKTAFPNLYSKIANLTKSSEPFKRNQPEFRRIEIQKLDISNYNTSNVLHISTFQTEPQTNVFCYIFKNGDLMLFESKIVSNDKLNFSPITIKNLVTKDLSSTCKLIFSILPKKNGIHVKYIKSMRMHEYKKGVLIHNLTYLLTVYINGINRSQINTSQSNSIQSSFPVANLYNPQFIPTFSIPFRKSPKEEKVRHLSAVASTPDVSSSSPSSATIHVKQDLELFFEQFLISKNIFVKTPSTISKCDFEHFHESPPVDLLIPAANITCIESNEKYQVVAVGCDDGRVIIHGMIPGIRLSSIQLSSDILPIPLLILITESCGFVLVYTSTSKLILATFYGTILKSIDNFNQINAWISFVPIDEQVDYVAFIGSIEKHEENERDNYADIDNNYLCVFEAANPDNIAVIAKLPGNCSQSTLKYDANENCFIIATYEKEIIVVSRSNDTNIQ